LNESENHSHLGIEARYYHRSIFFWFCQAFSSPW